MEIRENFYRRSCKASKYAYFDIQISSRDIQESHLIESAFLSKKVCYFGKQAFL